MSSVQSTYPKKILFTEGFQQNPYPAYQRLLEEAPIHYLDWGNGLWAVFSYTDCTAILKDPRLSAKRTGAFLLALPEENRREFVELARLLSLWMLFIDAPAHSRLRKLMNKGFSPAALESLRPQIEAIVDRMVEPLRHRREVELMHEIAHPLPVRVIAEMLGIPDTMQDQLVGWSNAIATFFGSPHRTLEQIRSAQQAVVALTEYFRDAVAKRRQQKGNDLISLLLKIEEDGDVLTEEELYAQCVMLLFGGHETTRNLIGNGMFTLLQHPEESSNLRERPEMIRTAVEELLRYESPVQNTARIAKEEMEVCDVRLRPGDLIAVMLGAANRDPQQFKDPGRLDLSRLNNSHLAFGAGPHFCIGNQLARMEAQVAILKMVREFPQMRLTSKTPEWAPNFSLRGLRDLFVAV
ncbi:MAG TPA: cytochrome P450 [Candidatus Acidoferrales bacterium]|nr:cytochrome P450 [Candidatus Acidoferrales bacterium]